MQISRLHDEPRACSRSMRRCRSARSISARAVADFMARYPDLRIELTLNDRFIDPLEEGVDVTVRIGDPRRFEPDRPPPRAGAPRARRLARVHRPPRRAERDRRPRATHRCLNYGHMATLQRWQLTQRGEDRRGADHLVSLLEQRRRAARGGARKATASPTCRRSSSAPTSRPAGCEIVLPTNPPTALGIYALYAPNRYLAAKTRVFIDFLVERFGEAPAWDAFAKTR